MKKPSYLFIAILLFLAANTTQSCGKKSQDTGVESEGVNTTSATGTQQAPAKAGADTLKVETQTASLENKYASVSVAMTLPVGDGVAKTIRTTLLNLMGTQIYVDADYSGDGSVKGTPYRGDTNRLKDVCNYYCRAIFWQLERENKKEYDENVAYINSDSSLSKEQREEQLSYLTAYHQDISLTKVEEAQNYVVFNDMTYGDRGGAHGGVGGYGNIIFNRATGKQVKSILKPGVARKMQRMLKDGLKDYFRECSQPVTSDKELLEGLMLPEGSQMIPLPQGNGIAPTRDGLTFIYAQYEIGCYALGMPSFTIPYAKVKEFMTDEALALLK